jgi:hypothetical protein
MNHKFVALETYREADLSDKLTTELDLLASSPLSTQFPTILLSLAKSLATKVQALCHTWKLEWPDLLDTEKTKFHDPASVDLAARIFQ